MMPFPGGPTTTENAMLIFAAVAALLYLFRLEGVRDWRRALIKTLSTGLLALLAFRAGGPGLLVAALVLSAFGDAFLAFDGDRPFAAGLASFLAGHVAYAALFFGEGGGLALLTAPRLLIGVAMVGLAIGLIARLRPAVPDRLRGPVTAYGAAILAMGLTALAVVAPLVVAGAALFMASDALLGTERFLLDRDSPMRKPARYAVWTLYWLGQAAIALGMLT
ncbi:MAG: lysoplasmalogenase [Phyllobacteriaceae bacterium]|nr:lysoplasmalogenase [Phyllobacteriaceae bacterium]